VFVDALHPWLHPPYIVGDFTEPLCAGRKWKNVTRKKERQAERKA